MKCELFLSPGEVPDYHVKGRRVVLIDVLRACTSLTIALEAGAERVIPAESVEQAKQLLAVLDREYALLAGEKEGAKLPGFDLGNSPGGFRDPMLAGKTVVFTSSNGAALMARMIGAQEQCLLSFVNMKAVVSYLKSTAETELMVICAGQEGRFSLEDAVCGGMVCDILLAQDPSVELNDGAVAAALLYQHHRKDLAAMLAGSSHGGFLARSGMAADLAEAAKVDSVPLVPVVRDGRITAARVEGV
jgi:2-phosphosulfolactate phosphatase